MSCILSNIIGNRRKSHPISFQIWHQYWKKCIYLILLNIIINLRKKGHFIHYKYGNQYWKKRYLIQYEILQLISEK